MEPRTQSLLSDPTLPLPDHFCRKEFPPTSDTALPDERSLLVVGRHVDARVFPEVINVKVVGQLGLFAVPHAVTQKICHLIDDAWQISPHLFEPDELQVWVMSPEPPGFQMCEIRPHWVVAVAEQVGVLFEGACEAHLRH